jgi:hypothetical protein
MKGRLHARHNTYAEVAGAALATPSGGCLSSSSTNAHFRRPVGRIGGRTAQKYNFLPHGHRQEPRLPSSVPQAATSTLHGQQVLQPLVAPVPYRSTAPRNAIAVKSMDEFGLAPRDLNHLGPGHKVDHILQNKVLAANINEHTQM